MNKDLNKESLLEFPGLREADKKILEDALRTSRPVLLEKIQQALTLGCDWKKILQKLNRLLGRQVWLPSSQAVRQAGSRRPRADQVPTSAR